MEHMEQYAAFSIYDIEGKALEFSPKLLKILGYTAEEVFAYQKEHGEVVTLFYPDIEERERIAAYQSELKQKGQAYEAIFFPRRKDEKKIALHFNTIPRKNKKNKVIGTYRFAKDVTMDHRDNIDLLTGAFDKIGFEKRFNDILTKKKIR
jgi:PAS domain S-box-containing protein